MQKNNALLKTIAQQNIMAHELNHKFMNANGRLGNIEKWNEVAAQEEAIICLNISPVQPLLNE